MPGPSASPPTSDGSTPNRNPPCSTGLLAAASRSRVGVERIDLWEGQVGDVPEHRLWAVSERGYQVDLRVYFGRADPTDSMLAEADAMLAGLEFPDWGLWELA
jgi:hypothetical protein